MDAKLKEDWLAALRGGEYQQGKGQLRFQYNEGENPHYCCLGVLLDVMDTQWDQFSDCYHNDPEDADVIAYMADIPLEHGDGEDFIIEDAEDAVTMAAWIVDPIVGEEKKFENPHIGTVMWPASQMLAHLNDEGKSFSEIADWIEANV